MNNIKCRVGSYLISDLNFIRCNETNLHLRTLNSLLVFAIWQMEKAFGMTCRTSQSGPPSKVVPNILFETKLKWSIHFWNFGLNGRYSMCLLAKVFHLWEVNPSGFGGEIAGTTVWCLCLSVNTNL